MLVTAIASQVMAMFSPVIVALQEASAARPAQLSAQWSPLRSGSIGSAHTPKSPVSDPAVVAAQQSELRQVRDFLSQLATNAALFSQLLEQVLYEHRVDDDNQVAGFSLSPGPLRQGFVLMHFDVAKVQANMEFHHVSVTQDWVKGYFLVTSIIGGVPHVSPLPSKSSLPPQPIHPARGQRFVVVTSRGLSQPPGLTMRALLGLGSRVTLAGPSDIEVRAAEATCTMIQPSSLHPLSPQTTRTPAPFGPFTGPFTPSLSSTGGSAGSSTSMGAEFARTTAEAEEEKNLKKNALKFATYLNLLGGLPGFESFHRASLGSQAFTLPQIQASFENIANANEQFYTFRLSTAFAAKLSVFIQGSAGNPNIGTLEHAKKLFVSDFWDTTMIRASAHRTTLDCTALVQALLAFATVLDLLLEAHPEFRFHVPYVDMFAPVLSFMSNCMNGLEPKALAHFVEVLFYNVFQLGLYALAPHTGLTETKQRIQCVITNTMESTRRTDFAVTYMQNMAHAQGVEARARNRVNTGAERLATGPTVIDLSTSPPLIKPPAGGGKRPPAPGKPDPNSPGDKRPKQLPGARPPCRANLGEALKVPGALPCTRGTACTYQHCTNIRVFIGTFGKPSLAAHIAGLPDTFRQGGGGVDLTKASYQAEWSKQG
jgi:hypothetical protein